jgi:hypothetical protein
VPATLRQFEQTMEGLKGGPLPDEAMKRTDYVWKTIENDASLDDYNDNVSPFKKYSDSTKLLYTPRLDIS